MILDQMALDRLGNLRDRLFTAIGQSLATDGHCKSYEGQFSIVLPNYFERDEDREQWTLTLDLYLIGPHRHYSWTSPSLRGAVIKADNEVSQWLAAHDEWWQTEGRELAARA